MSYVTAFNYGSMVGTIIATGNEEYIAAQSGQIRKEACVNIFKNCLAGGCIGIFINTGVQAVIKFTTCLIPEETDPQCTSSDYLSITCLALPCIFAASYLGSRL